MTSVPYCQDILILFLLCWFDQSYSCCKWGERCGHWASCQMFWNYMWIILISLFFNLGQTHQFWLMIRCFPAQQSSWGTFSQVEFFSEANLWREEKRGVLLQFCKNNYVLWIYRGSDFLSIYVCKWYHLLIAEHDGKKQPAVVVVNDAKTSFNRWGIRESLS